MEPAANSGELEEDVNFRVHSACPPFSGEILQIGEHFLYSQIAVQRSVCACEIDAA